LYERQSPGLGNTFLAAIYPDVQTLALCAGTHLKLDGFYRMLIKRFPIVLYNLINESSIDIYAILVGGVSTWPMRMRLAMVSRSRS